MSDHRRAYFENSLRNLVQRMIAHHSPPKERWGVVRRPNRPLMVEMLDTKAVLNEDDEDFYASVWLRRYDADHGIEVGDTVIFGTTPAGTLIAKDVVAEKHVTKGVRTDVADTSSGFHPEWDYMPTEHGHVVGFLDVHDKDSQKVGVSPVYEEDSLHDGWSTHFQPFVNGRIIGGYQLNDPDTDDLVGWVPVYADISGVPGWIP